MKTLILFDIDGTLVSGGPAKDAFCVAMVEVFGTAGPIEGHDFSGKTDGQIARELLSLVGRTDEQIDAGLPKLWDRYIDELGVRIAADPMYLLPGVVQVLDLLGAVEDVALGLVTGNIDRGADLKLGSAGLSGRFHIGGFGSDHEVRNHLPGIALRRAVEAWGVQFQAERVFVIGDTPRDVACGRHHGMRTVGVATGNHETGELTQAGADYAFADFAEAERVVEVILADH